MPDNTLVSCVLRRAARVRVAVLNWRIEGLMRTIQLELAASLITKRNRIANEWNVPAHPCHRLAINTETGETQYRNPDNRLPDGWRWF